jgi:hypothetical protein
MGSSRWVARCAAICVVLAAPAVLAQPSATQKETARALMGEARELREQGDLVGSLKRFKAADWIMGVPTTAYEVAVTQAQLGDLVEARETLRRLLALQVYPDDPPPFNEARSKAKALDQQLSGRISTLRFAVTGVNKGDAYEVEVDGEAVPPALVNLPLRVNPGKHVVVARIDNREVKREVETGEAQTLDVELAFGKGTGAGAGEDSDAGNASEGATAEHAAPGKKRHAPTLSYVGAGVAVTGFLVGSVAGISAISHRNAAKRDCVGNQCPPSTWSDLDKAHSMATVSTVGFVVGTLGAAVGIGAAVLGSSDAKKEHAFTVAPTFGQRSGGVSVEGRF